MAIIQAQANPAFIGLDLRSMCEVATNEADCEFPCDWDPQEELEGGGVCNPPTRGSIYDYFPKNEAHRFVNYYKDFVQKISEANPGLVEEKVKNVAREVLSELYNIVAETKPDETTSSAEILVLLIQEVKRHSAQQTRQPEESTVVPSGQSITLGQGVLNKFYESGNYLLKILPKRITMGNVVIVTTAIPTLVLGILHQVAINEAKGNQNLCNYKLDPGEIDPAKMPYTGEFGKHLLDYTEFRFGDFCPGTLGGARNYKINIYESQGSTVDVVQFGSNEYRFLINFKEAPYGADGAPLGRNVKKFEVDGFPVEYDTMFKFISGALKQTKDFQYRVYLGIIRSASNNPNGFIPEDNSDTILRKIIKDALYDTYTKAYFSSDVEQKGGLFSAKLRRGGDETPGGFVDIEFQVKNGSPYKESMKLADIYKKVEWQDKNAHNYYENDNFNSGSDLIFEAYDDMVANKTAIAPHISVAKWEYHNPAEPWFIKNDEVIDFTISQDITKTPRPVNLDIRVYGENVEILYEYVDSNVGVVGGNRHKLSTVLTQSALYEKAQAVFPDNFQRTYDAVAGADIIKEFFKNFVYGKYWESSPGHKSFRCFFYPSECSSD